MPLPLISGGSNILHWAAGQRKSSIKRKGCAPKRGSESPFHPESNDPTAGGKKKTPAPHQSRRRSGAKREDTPKAPGEHAQWRGGVAAIHILFGVGVVLGNRDFEFSYVRSDASPAFSEAKLLFPQIG